MNSKTSLLSLKNMTIIALMSALLCIIAPFAIPLPLNLVPLSLSTLVLYFTLYILGTKKALVSCIIYLLLGMVGLPVFANFAGGIGILAGPTGGYLIGYLPLLLIAGFFIGRFPSNLALHAVGLILGTASCYLIGTVVLAIQMSLSPTAALMGGVIPFLLGDSFKIILTLIFGPMIQKRLQKANLT